MSPFLSLFLFLSTGVVDDASVETAEVAVTHAPIRTARPLTIALEMGPSSLAGLGFNVSYSFTPHWALDTGFGWSVFGPKLGARGRYNFIDHNVTPFVAVGAMAAAAPWVDAEVVPMAQAVGGASWITDGGFSLMAAVGWMQRLDGKSGSWSTPITWTGSDVVYSVATGYSF